MNVLTENIFKLLKESGRTQTSLAEACNVDAHTVSRWKKGSIPQPNQIVKIAEFFGISVDILYRENASLKTHNPDYTFLNSKWEETQAFTKYLNSIGVSVKWIGDFIKKQGNESDSIGTIVPPKEVRLSWRDSTGFIEERFVSAVVFDSFMRKNANHLMIDIESLY